MQNQVVAFCNLNTMLVSGQLVRCGSSQLSKQVNTSEHGCRVLGPPNRVRWPETGRMVLSSEQMRISP